MKILITGMGGMLGQDLAAVLSKSHRVYGIGRKKRNFSHPGVKYFAADLLDSRRLARCVKEARPDVVIHAAAKTQVDDCELKPAEAYSENVLATQFLIRALRPHRPLFIYVSTDYIFDGEKKAPYGEEDGPRPLNVYGATKWLGEEIVKNSGLPWVIVRTSWLYGLKGPNFVTTILKLAKKRKTLKVVTDQKGSPTYTKDLAFAIRKIIEAGRVRGIFNVTSGGVVNWNGYAKEILKVAGVNHIQMKGIKTGDSARPALRPRNSVLNNAKFHARFGFWLRHWRTALGDYLKELEEK